MIQDGWITQSEVLLASIGSHTPEERELDAASVLRADQLIVDTYAGGVEGAADIGALVAQGLIEPEAVQTIGQVLLEDSTLHGLTVLKTVGFAAADLYAAKLVVHRAEHDGMGAITDFY